MRAWEVSFHGGWDAVRTEGEGRRKRGRNVGDYEGITYEEDKGTECGGHEEFRSMKVGMQ